MSDNGTTYGLTSIAGCISAILMTGPMAQQVIQTGEPGSLLMLPLIGGGGLLIVLSGASFLSPKIIGATIGFFGTLMVLPIMITLLSLFFIHGEVLPSDFEKASMIDQISVLHLGVNQVVAR